MRFNPQKCYIIHVAHHAHCIKMYKLCGVTQAKYLGVIISAPTSMLQWYSQLSSCCSYGKHHLALHIQNSQVLPQVISCSCIHVNGQVWHMEYCAGLWDPSKQQDKYIREKVNQRAACVVYNKTWHDRGVSLTSLLQSLNWLAKWQSLETRRHNQSMVLISPIGLSILRDIDSNMCCTKISGLPLLFEKSQL